MRLYNVLLLVLTRDENDKASHNEELQYILISVNNHSRYAKSTSIHRFLKLFRIVVVVGPVELILNKRKDLHKMFTESCALLYFLGTPYANYL